MRRRLFDKFMLATGMAVAMLFAGAAQADTYFTGTGTMCFADFTGAVELPTGATAGLVFFFEVQTDDPDKRLDGWQINFETHDLNKKGRGIVMGHLELHPSDGSGNVFTDIYRFKATQPFSSYYIDNAGNVIAEYGVSGGVEVYTCPTELPDVCNGYVCVPLNPSVPGFGFESTITGTIYDP